MPIVPVTIGVIVNVWWINHDSGITDSETPNSENISCQIRMLVGEAAIDDGQQWLVIQSRTDSPRLSAINIGIPVGRLCIVITRERRLAMMQLTTRPTGKVRSTTYILVR